MLKTSAVHKLEYEEFREDKHPIIFISGKDIAEILITSGYNTPEAVQNLLETKFPT